MTRREMFTGSLSAATLSMSSAFRAGTADASDATPGSSGRLEFKFDFRSRRSFPGTTRQIEVYVPAAYESGEAACLYIGLDGLRFNAAAVFDELIARREMPVTIAIGLAPGIVRPDGAGERPRYNRSFEFDSLGGSLGEFILQEVIPEVERRCVAQQRPLRLSLNPGDRAIGGLSTGAIAAFTIAWERPDAFRRVFSAIGTFVGMRGGDGYPVLVRKFEPKPLRVFLQDGSNDQWLGGPEFGDWWLSNQAMQRSLKFAGYDVAHVWGEGPHNDVDATAVFPDAMRWLWRDWPRPIEPGWSSNTVLRSILLPGEGWQAAPNRRIPETARNLARRHDGWTYQCEGGLWLVSPAGQRRLLDENVRDGSFLSLSPDELWLALFDRESRWGFSYKVRADRRLLHKQRYYFLHVPDYVDTAQVSGLACDVQGRLYVATVTGIQVLDRNGRVRAILPAPPATGNIIDLGFARDEDNRLDIVTNLGGTFTRRMLATGWVPGRPPIRLSDESAL